MRWKKRPESYEKRVAHPIEQKPEKNNEVLTLPATPSSNLFGNSYPFEQKSEKNYERTTTLPPYAVVTTTVRRGYSVSKRLVKLTRFQGFPLQLSRFQDTPPLSFVLSYQL